MRKLFCIINILPLLLIGVLSFAQTPPEGINYQAVARDTNGKAISSSINLVVRFTIWPDSIGAGQSLFTETHSPVNTNRYGLFALVIGSVNTFDFQNIVWPVGDKFLEVEIASVGGSSYISMGKTQLMSVPYALHSKTSDYSINNWSLQGNNSINTSNFIGTINSQDFVIKTAGTERMRVKSNGKVGIGATSPSALFSVGTASEFQIDSTGAIDTATGISSSGIIKFSGLSQNGVVRTIVNNGTLSSSGGPINLASEVSDTLPVINGGTGLGSLGSWQAFYSDSFGALTPFSLGATGTVFQSNGTAIAPTWVAPSSLMQNLTQGTGISTFTYNGSSTATVNISPTGISAGTYSSTLTGQTLTIPSFTVNAQGQLTAVSFPTVSVEVPLTFNNGLIRTSNNVQLGGPLVQNTVIAGNSFNTVFNLNGTGNFKINKNGGTSAFYVNPANGNIGVGTSVPGFLLHLDAITNPQIVVNTLTSNNAGAVLRLTEVNDLRGAFFRYNSNVNRLDIGMNDIGLNNAANDIPVISIIRANQFVGIGTTAPNTRVDIAGDIATKESSINLSGNSNNVAIGNFTFIRITGPTANFDITGFAGGVDGKMLIVANNTGFAVSFKDSNAGSLSSNQLLLNNNADVTLAKNGGAIFIYSAALSKWFMVGHAKP